MLPPLRPRRPAGLLAAAAIGFSSAALGGAGVASAAPTDLTFTAHTAETITVPTGTCAIDWVVVGGRGGADADGNTAPLPYLRIARTLVAPGDEFTLAPGGAGDSGAATAAGGTNSSGSGEWDGAAGNQQGLGGGGGGAASVVLKGDDVLLVSDGTSGAGDDGGEGAVIVESGTAVILGQSNEPASADATDGYISGVGVACGSEYFQRPSTPQVWSAAGGTAGKLNVFFQQPMSPDPAVAPVTGYEYTVDGGTHWVAATYTATPQNPAFRNLTISGLEDGKTYSVRVRATSSAGPSDGSTPVPGQTFTRPGDATDVAVETLPTALRITWAAPASTPVPVAGYEIGVYPEDFGMDSDWEGAGCDTGAATFNCVVRVPAGKKYDVHVLSVSAKDVISEGVSVRSDLVPEQPAPPAIPPTVPEKDGDLVGADGPIESVTAGKEVVIKGSGFAPFSTVRAIIYSTPQELRTFVTDENGEFEVTVTIPADLPAGEHSLVVQGVDDQGNPRTLRVDVTVSAAGTATVTDAALAATSSADELAYTGFSVAGPLLGGAAAVALGAGLLVASRRRTKA